MEQLLRIGRALSATFRMGVDRDMDPRRAKRIILSNQISLSVAFLGLPFVIIYLFNGEGLLGWMEIPLFFGYASVHRLNKAGFTRFSRIGLLTLANLDILSYTLSMGTSSGQNLFFLLCGWAPLVLFSWEERGAILYGIGLSSCLFLGTQAFVPTGGIFEPLPPGNVHSVRVMEVATMEIVQMMLLVYFFLGNRRTEIALARMGEAAQTADRAKGEFLARMSEEIRGPLNEILSLTHLLIKSSGAEKRETFDDIQMSAEDLLGIVDEILDLSRIEAGRMRIEAEMFSPLRLAHSILRPFEFEAGRKDVELKLDTDDSLPAHVIGDPARLKQILRNLIGNAFKFTETGQVVLRIRAEDTDDAQTKELLFEIEDSGVGIPLKARPRLFEPFSQADASSSRKYGGTGLGLFISKQIVELMGGSMGFRDREGGGTVFHFRLPLQLSGPQSTDPRNPDPEPHKSAPESVPVARSRSVLPDAALQLRILVVDDHPLNRKVMEELLASYGLKAEMARGGEEALAACERAHFHLVFMDCHMPGLDGYECTRRLRQSPRTGTRPTIIGVTADAMDANRRKCLDAGMDGVLIKPIMERELRSYLADCSGRV